MARKTAIVTLENQEFKITQMPALQLERWINRLAFAVGRGVSADALSNLKELFNPPKAKADGEKKEPAKAKADGEKKEPTAADIILSLLTSADYEKIEPLYDELLTCAVKIVGGAEQELDTRTINGSLEEVASLYKLRAQILALNFDFLTVGGDSQESAQIPAGITLKATNR